METIFAFIGAFVVNIIIIMCIIRVVFSLLRMHPTDLLRVGCYNKKRPLKRRRHDNTSRST